MNSVWLGLHQLHKFHNNPLHPVAMARRKRMFKQLANNHIEAAGTSGNWNSFAYIEKQQGQFTSAYADKARIAYILDEELSASPAAQGGVLFAASNSNSLDNTTPSNNDDNIISSSAGRLSGGVVTLDLKRLIRENETDEDSGQGRIWLFIKTTNMTAGSDVKIDLITECWGRWHSVVSQ